MADRENTLAEIAVTAAGGGLIGGSLVAVMPGQSPFLPRLGKPIRDAESAVCLVPLRRRHVTGERR